MTPKNGFLLIVAAVLYCGSAHAAEPCSLALKSETSGFFLNPTLVKVVVEKVTPTEPGQSCSLMVNDELLQVNDQVIPGQRAKAVMSYWKALPKDSPRVFKVRRAGSILALTVE